MVKAKRFIRFFDREDKRIGEAIWWVQGGRSPDGVIEHEYLNESFRVNLIWLGYCDQPQVPDDQATLWRVDIFDIIDDPLIIKTHEVRSVDSKNFTNRNSAKTYYDTKLTAYTGSYISDCRMIEVLADHSQCMRPHH